MPNKKKQAAKKSAKKKDLKVTPRSEARKRRAAELKRNKGKSYGGMKRSGR
jgi:hypothetical protein